MSLKHTLALLTKWEKAGTVGAKAQHVSSYGDVSEIVLTLTATGPKAREDFLKAVMSDETVMAYPHEDEEPPVPVIPPKGRPVSKRAGKKK